MQKKHLVKVGMLSLAVAFAGFNAVFASGLDEIIGLSKHVKKLNFSGDIRVRQENKWYDPTTNKIDRSRERFRLRLGITPELEHIKIGLRFASGGGEQVSTNQSFSNTAGQKGFYIDQAFIDWKVISGINIVAGRMANPFWTPYSADLIWDTDVNPEGFAQKFKYEVNENFTPYLNMGEFVLNEISGSTRDPWMYAAQAGAEVAFSGLNWNNALAYSTIDYEDSSLGAATLQEGNSYSGSTLVTDFRVLSFSSELTGKLGPVPFNLQGTFLTNTSKQIGSRDKKAGYQFGAILGKAKKKNTVEGAYFYKYSETDSTFAPFADADFGDGGTNRKGHILWVSYAPLDYVSLTAKALFTETAHAEFSPGRKPVNTLQLDAVIKF